MVALQAGTIVRIQSGTFHAECISARQALVVIENIVIDNFTKHRACRAAYGSAHKSAYNCSCNGANNRSNGGRQSARQQRQLLHRTQLQMHHAQLPQLYQWYCLFSSRSSWCQCVQIGIEGI